MNKKLILAALALTGTLGASMAHAGPNVQWSVTIPGPVGVTIGNGYPVYTQPYPVYTRPYPVYVPAPVYRVPARPIYYDRDRDGIPDRYDRYDNRRWDNRGWDHRGHDRDHDGIPNRYDRRDNRGDRDHDGTPDRYDRRDGRRG